jgi:hypothetical protein
VIRTRRQQACHLFLELGGQPFVIAVLEGDPFGACLADARIARRRRTAVLRAFDQPQPRIGDARCRRQRAVGGAVVDDDDLEILPALAQDAIDGVLCCRPE